MQSGSVWNSNKISLANSFDFWFTVFLGCRDSTGADGIVFILQPISTSVGTSGEGMGFEGVVPSIGIALDTWRNPNLNDPAEDHISIQANGNNNHNFDLAGPVPASATSSNIEDCQWHRLRIAWNAPTKTLKAYFDGVLRVEKQVDLVSTIFNNDPNVFWGFTGATGGSVNLQQFCTALSPVVKATSVGSGNCAGQPITFSEASESFAPIVSYTWSFGDGTFSTTRNPGQHTYNNPGTYQVNLKIKGQDGCESDSSFTVVVGSVPAVALAVSDTCFRAPPRVQLTDNNTAVSYQWALDGQGISTARQPPVVVPAEGGHLLQVTVSSTQGCGSPATANATFTIRPLPKLEALVQDGCVGDLLLFNGRQTDNNTTISRWQWNFGDGNGASSQNATHQFTSPAQYRALLWAQATNGCTSDTTTAIVSVNTAIASAGRDTVVIQGQPFQLSGSGNGSFLWSPPLGLSAADTQKPMATLDSDQAYVLTVTTTEGCVAKDTILIRTFKGPAIYVPDAFTPNGDGRNDLLKPVYVGIRQLKQFSVYDRWGRQVFSTKEMGRGWSGAKASAGTYVWLIQATDSNEKPVLMKGTVTIIR